MLPTMSSVHFTKVAFTINEHHKQTAPAVSGHQSKTSHRTQRSKVIDQDSEDGQIRIKQDTRDLF